MAKKKTTKVATYTFPKNQVIVFAVVFGLMGVTMALTTFAQSPGRGKNVSIVCNVPQETKLGSYYSGTISGIPKDHYGVTTLRITYGDGTEVIRQFQNNETADLRYYDMGYWDGTGNKATILGMTDVKVTSTTKQNGTYTVYGSCSTDVVQ